MLKLYHYFRSSASFRVRIALNLKNIAYEKIPVNLLEMQQYSKNYLDKNPAGLVPALELEDGKILHQSLSIIEYLEQAYPNSQSLFPVDLLDLAYVRAIAYDIAMDIHPLNNVRILNYLQKNLHLSDAVKNEWYQHWIYTGFDALETFLKSSNKTGKYCLGDRVSLADVCLVPQVLNAKRYQCDLIKYPLITKINDHCLEIAAFKNALPDAQEPGK